MAVTFAEGFATYREFTGPEWEPPPAEGERDRIAARLSDPDAWAALALVGEQVAGHVAFTPARERSAADLGQGDERPLVPGMAHLWQLFVRTRWWGEGVAPLLHERCLEEMRERGYRRARLFTPARQARARAFYERRGWRAIDEQPNAELGFDIAEYRLDL